MAGTVKINQNLVTVTEGGKVQSPTGFRAVCKEWGTGLLVFNYDGDLWFLSDKNQLEVRCPDYINDVRGTLKREYAGEIKLPPKVIKKLEELKKKNKKEGTN